MLWPHSGEASSALARPSPDSGGPGEGGSPFIREVGVVAPGSELSSLALVPLAYFPTGLPSSTNPCFWPLVLAACFFVGSSCGLTSVQLFESSPAWAARAGSGGLRSAGQVGSWRVPFLRDTRPLALRLQVVLPVCLLDVEVLTTEGGRKGGRSI